MGIYLPGAGTLGGVVYPGTRMAPSQGIPPDFYPRYMNGGRRPVPVPPLPLPLHATLYLSTPSTCLDECGFFKSLVVRFPYILIF